MGIGKFTKGKFHRITAHSEHVSGTVLVQPLNKFNTTSEEICRMASLKFHEQNRKLFNSHLTYQLVYPDGSTVGDTLPDLETPFSLAAYKSYKGVSYDRIRLYICAVTKNQLRLFVPMMTLQ